MNSAAKACTVLVIGLAGCQQNESDWIVFGTSDSPQFNETYSYQARSVEVFETKSKELAGVMIVSILDNRSKQIRLRKWHILEAHCRIGYGKVLSTELDGKTWVNTYDYANSSGSIVSSGADILCGAILKK